MSWGLEVIGNLSTSIVNMAGNVSLHGYEGLFSPPALTSWRVTPENPVRYAHSLDVERCVALHNEIVQYGWGKSSRGQAGEELEAVNWYERSSRDDAYRDEQLDSVRPRLSSPLAAFLDGALTTGVEHSFFYHVSGLNSPSQFFFSHEDFHDDLEKDRFLTLYAAHNLASHPDGLVYDQFKHKAIMQMSIFDSDYTQNGRTEWMPLEVILTAWLNMVDVDKVQAVPDDVEFQPWIMVPYSEEQLDSTVTAFNRLVDAIESRMPHYQPPTDSQHVLSTGDDRVQQLLSTEDVEAAGIPIGFAQAFLIKAKRPSFRYIAPGLSIPTPESIRTQPFRGIKEPRPEWLGEDEADPTDDNVPPILLFSSGDNYETWRDPDRDPKFPDSDRPFFWPYSPLRAFPAGLYLEPRQEGAWTFEDAVKLVTAEPIGAFGYARKADGSRFGENVADKHDITGYGQRGGTFRDLFQLGHNPYGEMHGPQLEAVLDAWRACVESGEWRVGEHGVAESMKKWHDADTRSKWDKYVVPMKW